jgi:hypothetical protein
MASSEDSMARRGLVSTKKIIKQAIGTMIEPLEIRRLLTTWVGGGIDANGNPIFNEFFYTQPDTTVMEAKIGGNTTVEAIFYDGTTIQPAETTGDLFQLYVARSDINSVISIFPVTTTGMVPFSSASPSLLLQLPSGQSTANDDIPNTTPQTAVGPAASGAGVLGGLNGTAPSVPVVKQNINGIAIGVRPAGLDDLPNDPSNDLSAGLVVAPGLSLGKFLFGGEVFGKVDVPGNMNLFYAGWLLTGDARGATEGSGGDGVPVSRADNLEIPSGNFFVGGDLQNLATTGPIGWDGIYGGSTPIDQGDPHYLSGVDIEIGGKLGSIDALGGDAASVHVLNNGLVTEPVEDQEELEGLNARGDFSTGELQQPTTTGAFISPFVNNDFLHAQFLGDFDTTLGTNTIRVDGRYDTAADVNTDPDDYYGVGLMAGQTITIQLSGNSEARIGVFDPNGILIATDYDQSNSTADPDQPFQITASAPGEYRIAVSTEGDVNFNNFVGTSLKETGPGNYTLSVTNVGNLAVGGIVTQGTSLETNAGWQKLEVDNGDVGGIYAATNFHVTDGAEVLLNTAAPNPLLPPPENIGLPGIEVANGNLRSFVGGAIGLGDDTTGSVADPFSAPDLDIPKGSVGLIQALTGILEINPNNLEVSTAGNWALQIGGDYEVVQGSPGTAEDMILGLVADGAIGEINGPNMAAEPSVIVADADSTGDDGTIDSIDIAGNLDDAYIWHGPGGDMRFMRVGGLLLNDGEFSTGSSQRVAYNYNQSVTLTDDSGSTVTLVPLGPEIPNPVFNAAVTDKTNIQSIQAFGPRLSVRAYPIASGGVCIVDVSSTGGLAVNTNANGTNGQVEISRIEVHGSAGAPVETLNTNTGMNTVTLAPIIMTTTTQSITTTQVTTGTNADGTTGPITTTTVTPLTFNTSSETDVTISGSAVTDVANIIVMAASPLGSADFPITPVSAVTELGNATTISNTTGGDIIGVAALGIGNLTAKGDIGLGHTSIPGLALRFNSIFTVGASLAGPRSEQIDPSPPNTNTNEMPVNPTPSIAPGPIQADVGNSYPFDGQTFGIAADGDVVLISAGGGIGNIVVGGILQQITADSDHNSSSPSGMFAGVDAPIWAFSATGAINTGTINQINIGQGVLPSGTGSVSFAGIYANDIIGSITGNNADIRGDIISGGRILGINLTNGSLINTQVMIIVSNGTTTTGFGSVTYPDWAAARQNSPFNGGVQIPHTATSSFSPQFDISSININGNGGVIGSVIQSYNMGNINVGGFGIINSVINAPFDGRLNSLTVGGYGLRTDNIGTGATIGSINATGNGSELATTSLDPGVRQSQSQPIDPFFSGAFDPFSGKELTSENDIDAALGTSSATPIITGVTETGVIQDTEISGSTSLGSLTAQMIRASVVGDTSNPTDPTSPANPSFPMEIDFGNNIGSITTRGVINGLRVVSGTLKSFNPGSDVLGLFLQTSGKINKLSIKGSLAGNSVINASGTNGGINKITIAHDLVGTINVQNNVSSITVGGNLSGQLNIAGSHKGTALGKLTVGGSVLNGSLNVTGNVGTIQTAGSLGVAGNSLTFTGSLAKLIVGHGNLAANLTVNGKVGTIEVNGAITGDIIAGTVSGSFQNLIVNGSVDATITINGTLQNAKISNGNVNESINAVDGINKFTIVNGSLSANQSIQSSLKSIGSLIITGGDLFGSVLAPVGTIKTINVSNNLGDGIDPLNITTTALNTLSVGSSILSGVKGTVTGPLGALIVGGSIEPGATISATSNRTLVVGGSIAPGSVQIG